MISSYSLQSTGEGNSSEIFSPAPTVPFKCMNKETNLKTNSVKMECVHANCKFESNGQ
jgi:hypothetical protein